MKCISKQICIFLICVILCCVVSGCGNLKYDIPYTRNNSINSLNIVHHVEEKQTINPFAANLCISSSDKTAGVELDAVNAAGLFHLNKMETLYAQNLDRTLHPASLTKVMTALVAMKYCSLDQVLTASDTVKNLEADAQKCGIEPGDRMTLDQALHILLIYSANDVALMIAENVSGTVDAFVDIMNQELLNLGATNSHFTNPTGLTEENHYVTAYDMYLVFNEAIKYSSFNEIIQMSSYETIYYNAAGNEKNLKVETTNMYLKGNYAPPSGVTVIGGKTGSTSAAGHCLLLYSKDTSGNPYISVLLNMASRDELYVKMTELLLDVAP